MLKEIVSISGKPGLFRLVSKKESIFVVESLIDQKRVPAYINDKIVSLGDITIFTNDEPVRLSRIFQSIKQNENGKPILYSPSITPEELRSYFSHILPDFDRDRVYPSEIKKIMSWYNLLIRSGITVFEEEKDTFHDENEMNEINEE